jgi:hypothetical protein
MMNRSNLLAAPLATLAVAALATAQSSWVNFVNQTSSRLVMSPSLQNDNLEKDFAFGDFDQDGDVDLICVRKFPGSITGGFPNILFMNEGGILVDRTSELGTASDAAGYQGLLDPTNDRDVKAVDVDGDGWLDLVTHTTMSDHVNHTLGQPRVYRNLGDDAGGSWQGFRFEKVRIPQLFALTGATANPRACDAVVHDLTGDGYPDIFFVDYDTPETSGTICIDLNGDGDTNDAGECQQSPAENPTLDYNNKFLVNWGVDPAGPGPGHFFDSVTTRFTSAQLDAAFGNAVVAGDFNRDGAQDVARINTLTGGQNVAILYGKTGKQQGLSFTGPVTVVGGAPYNMETADLNNDGKLDFVVVDDGQDKFVLNNGNNAQGQATFTSYTIATSVSEFGNTVRIADLDNDGFLDVLIADVDADLGPFCPSSGRRAKIYRNNGNVPNINLAEVGTVLPLANLASTYDFAPIDINGDGYLDLVTGRCSGIEVWMNNPPIGLAFTYPSGRPTTVVPGTATPFTVNVAIAGGGTLVDPRLMISVNGAAFGASPLVAAGGTSYAATLPAVNCGDSLRFYVTSGLTNGGTYSDPPTAPSSFFTAGVSTGTVLAFSDDFETESGWTVANTGAVTTGTWERGDPNGVTSTGVPVVPGDDYTPAPGVNCFVTYNAPPGTTAANGDLDGGPTVLTSPAIDLLGSDVQVSFATFFYCNDAALPAEADFLVTQVSSDGTTWVTADTVGTTSSQWQVRSFRMNDFIVPSAATRMRFVVNDTPNNSVTEAAVDAIRMVATVCEQANPCPADLDGDDAVTASDLAAILAAWGQPGPTDLDGDGTTGAPDLAVVLAAWGGCP